MSKHEHQYLKSIVLSVFIVYQTRSFAMYVTRPGIEGSGLTLKDISSGYFTIKKSAVGI